METWNEAMMEALHVKKNFFTALSDDSFALLGENVAHDGSHS